MYIINLPKIAKEDNNRKAAAVLIFIFKEVLQ